MQIKHEYFSDKELKCKCGCGASPGDNALERLYALRIIYGKPINVTSGARCSDYNKEVGGSAKSKHMNGVAFDCKIPKADELKFIFYASFCGFKGVGFKDNVFIHIDTRSGAEAMWGY